MRFTLSKKFAKVLAMSIVQEQVKLPLTITNDIFKVRYIVNESILLLRHCIENSTTFLALL